MKTKLPVINFRVPKNEIMVAIMKTFVATMVSKFQIINSLWRQLKAL
ncbi:hypothetical protein GGD38_005700 [Chitinophagaceae bacterium OAS944]|nr:hypothetical protein [Chitinophagaceae bacterium OAS944]